MFGPLVNMKFELVGEPGPRALSDLPDDQLGICTVQGHLGRTLRHAVGGSRDGWSYRGRRGKLEPGASPKRGRRAFPNPPNPGLLPPKSWFPKERTAPAVSWSGPGAPRRRQGPLRSRCTGRGAAPADLREGHPAIRGGVRGASRLPAGHGVQMVAAHSLLASGLPLPGSGAARRR